ncbi:hypothetical protein ACFVGN_29190 [Streptomyces sp. NPDC057757]|uniref:hypothetical protein n=1 Tax=Streptomyces sp. NPDC057757 TaxID=3346241 RepID=UPI00367ABB39
MAEARHEESPTPGARGVSGMTLRVYTVDRAGTITSDSGTRHVSLRGDVIPLTGAFPKCSCPNCAKKAAPQ